MADCNLLTSLARCLPKPPDLQPKQPLVVEHRVIHPKYSLPMADKYTPAWATVLRACGYPEDVLVIDFETYFDEEYSLKDVTTVEFIADPRFEVVSVAYTQMNTAYPFADYEAATHFGSDEEEVGEEIRYLQGLYGMNFERATVVIANAKFDATVLAKKYGIYCPHVIDVIGLARAINSRQKHGIETLAKQHGLIEKGDTSQFKGATFRTRFKKPKGRGNKAPVQAPKITDELLEALRAYNVNDNLREWELFTILLPMLSNPKVELRLMRHTLDLYLKPVLRCDFAEGERLAAAMQARLDSLIPEGMTPDDISGNISFEKALAEALTAAGDDPQQYMKHGKLKQAFAIAKDDPEREQLEKHPDERVRKLMAARGGIKSWPNHITRVRSIMAAAKACDGLMPVPLRYCGAHTGRWSGDDGLNLQNLSKQGDPLLVAIRGLLVAPEGYTLVIVDASQIEARVLAWIAGQDDLVAAFERNADPYIALASKMFGFKVRKPKRKGNFIEAVEARMESARNFGKIGVLGCGYGMGAKRAVDYAATVYKVVMDEQTATKLVDLYRAENPAITAFWTDTQKAFAFTAKYRKPCELPRGLRFDPYQETGVTIALPNGRELHYGDVRIVYDTRGRGGGDQIELFNGLTKDYEPIWGGHLTENIVQAISRDVLAEAMLRLEDRGWHVCYHCHDEVMLAVPIDQGKTVYNIAVEEMSRTPSWATGLPLGAEGVISERFGKH